MPSRAVGRLRRRTLHSVPGRRTMRTWLLLALAPAVALLVATPGTTRLVETSRASLARGSRSPGSVAFPGPSATYNSGSGSARPRVLTEFSRLAHGLRSGKVTVVDSRTFRIPRLHYDGTGPDAYFLVGKGRKVSARRATKVPDETGSLEPLKRYRGESITIELPDKLRVSDFDWLAMYCIQHRHNFGQVTIPKDLDVPEAPN